MNDEKRLAILSYKYAGNYFKIRKAILEDEKVEDMDIKESYITIISDGFPDCLKKLKFPPLVLFYKGDLSLLDLPKVSVVGSRIVNDYAIKVTEELCHNLRKNYCLVSGLALGVDSIAHECALEEGKTIGIIASGLDTHYPYQNEPLYQKMMEKGLIISEYPHFVKVKKYHFAWRNRLIAALGDRLYVTSGAKHSGTMLTVNEALELDKPIYCVPYGIYDINGEGCNMLIEQGANMIMIEDIR